MQYHTDEIRAPLWYSGFISMLAPWAGAECLSILLKKKNSTVLVKFWGHISISFSSHIEGIENRGAYS